MSIDHRVYALFSSIPVEIMILCEIEFIDASPVFPDRTKHLLSNLIGVQITSKTENVTRHICRGNTIAGRIMPKEPTSKYVVSAFTKRGDVSFTQTETPLQNRAPCRFKLGDVVAQRLLLYRKEAILIRKVMQSATMWKPRAHENPNRVFG